MKAEQNALRSTAGLGTSTPLRSEEPSVTRGIFIIHTGSQLEQASNLVDLLEASLAIPSGAIVCSSLPGYAWSTPHAVPTERSARFTSALDSVGAAIAIVDAASLRDPQLFFDLACVWSRGKRVALLADSTQVGAQLPEQLSGTPIATRVDRASVVSMVEDLAFDLGLSPRIGQDAYRALEQLSSIPPPLDDDTNGRFENTKTEQVVMVNALRMPPLRDEFSESKTQAAPVPRELLAESSRVDIEELDPDEDALQLSEADVEFGELREDDPLSETSFSDEALSIPSEPLREEPLREDLLGDQGTNTEPLRERPRSVPPLAVSCGLSLEAGRAISECSYHRDDSDFSLELDDNFGRFIDAVGGNWDELRRLGDLDVWLGATDNLLESLPVSSRYISEWYELGFQFSMLRSLAEEGVPDEPDQRAAYEELWTQSMSAFRQSAQSARISPRESRRVQALLENLVGPDARRDYSNVARSLHELRALAEEADRA